MKNWNRFTYQPGLPLGKDGRRVTGGEAHIALSREAEAEGMGSRTEKEGKGSKEKC